ncbi:aminotransferase family protein-like protein [Podospora didyma]|uniref:Aminotransferase family protein-like protein n=1 Tax=Podospora didyma TaxID=330526 RepID=A0AAE0JYA0_9PEZI|nr:aminotransferase family protein-like protein [Podospora didyma]
MDAQGLNDNTIFGAEFRCKHFLFSEKYWPLNHGSFGTIPRMVQEYQQQLQLETEARPDTFFRYTHKDLLNKSRLAVATLLGADAAEVVLVPNATTGVNTILRNLTFGQGDVILYFNTIYGACAKSLQSLSEVCSVSSHQINITYPIQDDEILCHFRHAAEEVKAQGKQPKLAMFETVLTFPGALFPWESLVAICKELGIMSLIDGAHGLGHIDLTNLGNVKPDFMVSNCYKWLMVPRGCAVLYVPFQNQKLISSSIPTSWGYESRDDRAKMDPQVYFSRLFEKVATTDTTPYLCIPQALKFRSEICGGETQILKYCQNIVHQGGEEMAKIMDTEVLGGSSSTFQRCCFANVRLPLTLKELAADESCGQTVARWMQELTPVEYETYLPIRLYDGQFWCRISGQIYLTMSDFEWAAKTLLDLCKRAKEREWA